MNGHFPNYHAVIRVSFDSRGLPYHQEHVEFLYQSRVGEKKPQYDIE